jgi:hypothetical protein
VKRTFVGASTVAGVVAFAYALSTLGLAHVREGLLRIGWGFGVILALSGLRDVARAVAWTRTLDATGRLPVFDALRARLFGEALNTLLPMGFVFGEPAKAQQVANRLPFATAFASLMIEFAFYTGSLALLFGPTALLVLPPAAALAIFGLGAAVIPLLKRVTRAVEPLRRFAQAQPRRAGTIVALEASYHALGVVETYVVLLCISPAEAAWTSALLLEAMNRGVTMVFKMLPLRVGVDEASAAFVTDRLGLGSTTGVMLALVRKLRMLFWAALGLACIRVRADDHGERTCAAAADPTAQNLRRTALFPLV